MSFFHACGKAITQTCWSKDSKNLFDNSNILILLFEEKVDMEPFTSIYEISEPYLKSGL